MKDVGAQMGNDPLEVRGVEEAGEGGVRAASSSFGKPTIARFRYLRHGLPMIRAATANKQP